MHSVGDDVAAIIIEPIAGNMNMIEPTPEFLTGLKELCGTFGALLIFDEVMTGFRVALGGAQAVYDITPDLTTFGKVIGGGLPVGAFGGRADVMAHIAPEGPVYQAGTLSGNPIAMAAGMATLDIITEPGFFDQLTVKAKHLCTGLSEAAAQAGVPFSADSVGGMFGLYFTDQPVNSFADLAACDEDRFKRFFHSMLEQGVYLAPSAYEAGFISSTHDEAVITQTIDAATRAFKE